MLFNRMPWCCWNKKTQAFSLSISPCPDLLPPKVRNTKLTTNCENSTLEATIPLMAEFLQSSSWRKGSILLKWPIFICCWRMQAPCTAAVLPFPSKKRQKAFLSPASAVTVQRKKRRAVREGSSVLGPLCNQQKSFLFTLSGLGKQQPPAVAPSAGCPSPWELCCSSCRHWHRRNAPAPGRQGPCILCKCFGSQCTDTDGRCAQPSTASPSPQWQLWYKAEWPKKRCWQICLVRTPLNENGIPSMDGKLNSDVFSFLYDI